MIEAGNLHSLLGDIDPTQKQNNQTHFFSKKTKPEDVLKDAIINSDVLDKKVLQMYVELSLRSKEFNEDEFYNSLKKHRPELLSTINFGKKKQGKLSL